MYKAHSSYLLMVTCCRCGLICSAGSASLSETLDNAERAREETLTSDRVSLPRVWRGRRPIHVAPVVSSKTFEAIRAFKSHCQVPSLTPSRRWGCADPYLLSLHEGLGFRRLNMA